MSADNYSLIRRYLGKFVVTGESASSEFPHPLGVREHKLWHTIEEARAEAHRGYTEYGVQDWSDWLDFGTSTVEVEADDLLALISDAGNAHYWVQDDDREEFGFDGRCGSCYNRWPCPTNTLCNDLLKRFR